MLCFKHVDKVSKIAIAVQTYGKANGISVRTYIP